MYLTVLLEDIRTVGHVLQGNPGGVLGRIISAPLDKKLNLATPCTVV
jgi:hypothetical protein